MLDRLSKLQKWFRNSKRELPWRMEVSAYRTWVSEIMLQQTQVSTVIDYFNRWMKHFPTVEALAQASEDEVLHLWSGLGYYSRARNLWRAAQQIGSQSKLEQAEAMSREYWLNLPGVGPYTAGAVLSIAYEIPSAMVDGNIERVFSRWYGLQRGDLENEFKKNIEKLALEVVETIQASRKSIISLNSADVQQALMELGATICQPKNAGCLRCPVNQGCKVFEGKLDPALYPGKKLRKATEHVWEGVQVFLDPSENRVWLEPSKKWRKGLYDFPTVDLESHAGETVWEMHYQVTHHKVNRRVFLQEMIKEPQGFAGRWVSITDPEVPLGKPSRWILDRLRESRSL